MTLVPPLKPGEAPILHHPTRRCTDSATIAHQTRTKSHHYLHRAGGLGWLPPSNLSVAIHGLKSYGQAASGPNRTRGGEWHHVHGAVAAAAAPAFPSLLWRYANSAAYTPALDAPASAPLLTPLNPYVMEWHFRRLRRPPSWWRSS